MPKFNHMLTLAFTVETDTLDGSDITREIILEGLRQRIADIENSDELFEATLPPADTYEVPDMTEDTTETLTPHSLLINWCDGDDEQGNFSWAGLALDDGDAEIQARSEMCNSLYGDELEDMPDDVMKVGGSIVDHYEGANMWAAKQGLDALRAAVAWVEKTGIADSEPQEYLDMKAAIERLEGR